MKFKNETLFGCIIGAALVALPIASQMAAARTDRHHQAVQAGPSSPVYSPTIPESVEFAGKTISLDPVDMAERFDRELTAMSYTHGNTLLTLKRANRVFPQIVPILKKQHIPEDFVYLAAIESHLGPRAVSGAGAAGLWQFMRSTAKEYGLEVNDEVDERFDIEKSTEAACRYLRNAYAKYGNWESVAASYNGGMGRISKELQAQQATSAYDLWLAEETMRYVFRLLAMKTIMEHPARYGYRLTPEQLYQPVSYKTFTVDGPVADWPQWAKDRGSDYRTLREHNPWIRAKSLANKTGKTYTVRLPEPGKHRMSKRKISVYNPAWVVTPDND